MNKKENLLLAKQTITDAGLYIITSEDIENLANIAGNAYENYPLHNWFSNGIYDTYLSQKIMEISLKAMLKKGVIYSDKKISSGFAIWLPPGFKGTTPFSFIVNGGISLLFHCGFSLIFKLLSYENFAMKLKKKYTNNEDWYLYNLSVHKDYQGKGIASQLLIPMLDFCSKNSYSCYLETNNQKNIHIYEHFGFKLKEMSFIPNSKVNHYAMLKE